MKAENVHITILPQELVLAAHARDNLQTLLLVNNLLSDGGDAVRLEKGSVSAALDAALEEARFSATELADGWMLASQRQLTGDAVFFVPQGAEETTAVAPAKAAPLPEGLTLAVDLGPGSIMAGLVELPGRGIPAYTAIDNSQCKLLGDLGARIQYIREQEDGLAQMQALLWKDLAKIIDHLTEKTGLAAADIHTLVVAANTTLEQMLWGETPSPVLPEGVAWVQARNKSTADTPLAALLPRAQLQSLPASAADLGSDLVAGLLATGLEQKMAQHEITLLIDTGLVTGIVAAGRGRLLAASVSTPALEGVGLVCGMRTTTGAITDVHLDSRVWLDTVRDARPRGLCGAGLLAAANLLLQNGLLTEDGRILMPEELTPELAPHFQAGLGSAEFILSKRQNEPDIYLEQNDIRHLQLAKGSIYATCMALLAELEATEAEIAQILLAESFGANLNPQAALALGLTPQVPVERIKSLGNVSWQGAYLCLGNQSLLAQAQKLAAQMERLDLAANLVYAEQFLPAMNFREAE